MLTVPPPHKTLVLHGNKQDKTDMERTAYHIGGRSRTHTLICYKSTVGVNDEHVSMHCHMAQLSLPVYARLHSVADWHHKHGDRTK